MKKFALAVLLFGCFSSLSGVRPEHSDFETEFRKIMAKQNKVATGILALDESAKTALRAFMYSKMCSSKNASEIRSSASYTIAADASIMLIKLIFGNLGSLFTMLPNVLDLLRSIDVQKNAEIIAKLNKNIKSKGVNTTLMALLLAEKAAYVGGRGVGLTIDANNDTSAELSSKAFASVSFGSLSLVLWIIRAIYEGKVINSLIDKAAVVDQLDDKKTTTSKN